MDTISSIILKRGEPLLRFKPKLISSDPDLQDHIPIEIAVFKLDNHHGGCITFSRFNEDVDQWHANSGERFVISHLLNQNS